MSITELGLLAMLIVIALLAVVSSLIAGKTKQQLSRLQKKYQELLTIFENSQNLKSDPKYRQQKQ